MTREVLQTKIVELEAMIKTGSEYALAEIQARALLTEDVSPKEPELHCRILLVISLSLWQRSMTIDALPFAEEALMLAQQEQNGNLLSKSLGSIGIMYYSLANYPKALEYYNRALAEDEKLDNRNGIARLVGNIGLIYYSLSDYPKALEYYGRALALCEDVGDKHGMSNNLGNTAVVYRYFSDNAKALEYFSRALALDEELGNNYGIAKNIGNIGLLYKDLNDAQRALEYMKRAYLLFEEIGNKNGAAANIGNIGSVYLQLSDYPKALECYHRALEINKELGEIHGVAIWTGNIGNVYRHVEDYSKALEYYSSALMLFDKIGSADGIAQYTGNIGLIYAEEKFTNYNITKAEEALLQSLYSLEKLGKIKEQYELHKALASLYERQQQWKKFAFHYKKYYELKEEMQNTEIKKQAERLDYDRKTAEREKQIAIERTSFQERVSILNNILPEEITTRLIKGENPIADQFDSVSILFMDIVDFTVISTKISAQQLVHLLNAIFTAADGVMREFGLEKIKTIGDAYMAVAGAPIAQEDHAINATNAALRLLDIMKNLVVTFPEELSTSGWIESLPEIQVRIGLHCGPVAAGVVGESKFLYDLWGDAVNTASRMESHGEAGKIHVSEEFVHQLTMGATLEAEKNRTLTIANCPLTIIPRGEMEIKGKGMMQTYFLKRT